MTEQDIFEKPIIVSKQINKKRCKLFSGQSVEIKIGDSILMIRKIPVSFREVLEPDEFLFSIIGDFPQFFKLAPSQINYLLGKRLFN